MTERGRTRLGTVIVVTLLIGCGGPTTPTSTSGAAPGVDHAGAAITSTRALSGTGGSATGGPTAHAPGPGPGERRTPPTTQGDTPILPPMPPRLDPPAGLPAQWGVAYLTAGGEVQVSGSMREGPAWSTIKVPLAVASLRASGGSTETAVHAALSWSDNASAGVLWSGLGPPGTAGAAVDDALRSLDDATTTTQTVQVHPPYSPFGQTTWGLADQVRMMAALSCADDPAASTVLTSMGQVVPQQSWGLGAKQDARFKGGWGPGPDGRYLVRQLGLVTLDDQAYAVALAARADDGTFTGGIAALDTLASWLWIALPEHAAAVECSGG